MKRSWKIWIPLLLMLCCAGVIAVMTVQYGKDEPPEVFYRVLIDDKEVDWYAKRSVGKLMLPFLALAESLGIPADWQNDATAHLSFADRTWVFSTKDGSLKQLGANSDALLPPPGSIEGKWTETAEQDVYIDTISLGWFLREYIAARIEGVDEEQQVVRITRIQKEN